MGKGVAGSNNYECGKCGKGFFYETDYYNHYDNKCKRRVK